MSRITRNKEICGEPIIQGTRITVRAIVEYLQIYQSKERIRKGLPHLTLEIPVLSWPGRTLYQ